jgi:hypothetical protein
MQVDGGCEMQQLAALVAQEAHSVQPRESLSNLAQDEAVWP